MKKLALLIALLWLVFGTAPLQAQNALQLATCGTFPRTLQAGDPAWIGADLNGNLCVSASVTASVTGFAPAGTFATLTATGSSASVALPAGAVVLFQNTGTTAVSCTLGVGSATALVSENIIQPSSWIALTVGSNTFGACIDQTGSASNVVVLSGGSGLPTGAGGGGGSGGSVTQGTTPWVVDGSGVTQPVSSTTLATAANQTTANTSLATIATNTGAAIPAGTNNIGNVGQISQYPTGAVIYTASATGTTAATTATLTGAGGVTTYICGFSIRANATAAATGNATVTGTITGTLNFTQWTAPNASGLGISEMIFPQCIPASATNTSIAVVSAAPGTGGVVSVTAWGYKL